MSLVSRFFSRFFPKPTPPAPTPIPNSGFVDALNGLREIWKLRPLKEDPALVKLASDWASAMASAGLMSHGINFLGRIRSVYPNRAAAENVAGGQGSITVVLGDWLGSPGHRANLLGDWTITGIATATSKSGTPYWCAVFVK
jgi:uncharacterized protein YkwD